MSSDDEARFRALFDEHLGDIWRFARRRVSSAADADDVAAETFGVAWRRRDRLPPNSDVRLWLFGVVRNVLANHNRSESRRRRLHLRLVSTRDPEASAPEAGESELGAALAGLRAADREVLVLRCWDGLAVHEIAALLGCSPNAVSVRLHRARRRLAARLGKKDPGPSGQVMGDPDAAKDRRHA